MWRFFLFPVVTPHVLLTGAAVRTLRPEIFWSVFVKPSPSKLHSQGVGTLAVLDHIVVERNTEETRLVDWLLWLHSMLMALKNQRSFVFFPWLDSLFSVVPLWRMSISTFILYAYVIAYLPPGSQHSAPPLVCCYFHKYFLWVSE